MRFTDCSVGDLETVAVALVSGQLQVPTTQLAINRLGVSNPELLLDEITSLVAAGWGHGMIAQLLSMLASERREASKRSAKIDLVITGPDVNQRTRDTAVVVGQLFSEAQNSVLVVGFALYKGELVFRRLADRLDQMPDLKVTLCLDISRRGTDTTRDSDVIERFADRFVKYEWPGKVLPKVYYDPRGLTMNAAERAVLHAKCVVIDRRIALVTSANPTPAAYSRNIEMGLVIEGGNIPEQVVDHFNALIEAGKLQQVVLHA